MVVKRWLKLALLRHLLAEAEELVRALLVVHICDVVVQEIGDTFNEELTGGIVLVLSVDLGKLLHERLVGGDLFEIDENEFDFDGLLAVVDELAQDLDDLHEIRLHLLVLPFARQYCNESQGVLLR